MPIVNVDIRTDADLKKQFKIYDEIPNAETIAAIEEVKRMKSDKNLGKSYSEVDGMVCDLLKDV